MTASRLLRRLVLAAAAAACLPVAGQSHMPNGDGPWSRAASRAYLGLNANTAQYRVGCGIATLGCVGPAAALSLRTGQAWGGSWGAEVGIVDLSRAWRGAAAGRNQGLNLSLVGRAPLGASFGMFGKFGATYGFADGSPVTAPGLAMGADSAFGFTYGAGVSYDFSPRLSATLGWDSHDFRFSGRDPVRATSVGLQYRY